MNAPQHIDGIVFSNAVRYERLRELINYAFVGSNANNINIYIDMYPIIRSIYADTYQVKVDDYIGLAPSIINNIDHKIAKLKQGAKLNVLMLGFGWQGRQLLSHIVENSQFLTDGQEKFISPL